MDMDLILRPTAVRSRHDVLAVDCVPKLPGVYAWYFRPVLQQLPTNGCVSHDGRTLLYIDISPKCPLSNGRVSSSHNLRSRVRNHMLGNAEGSTLRLTLGVSWRIN
jgi:hypothetical protein